MNKFKQVIKFIFVHHLYVMPLLFIIDIASKLIVEDILLGRPERKIEFIKGFFSFELTYNPGSFSGFLGNIPNGTFILMCFSLIGGILAIVYFVKKFKKMPLLIRIAMYLLIPGCFGNMVDRFLTVIKVKEGVIDFISFILPIYGKFNTFNFADMCLTVSMFMILFSLIYEEIKKARSEKKLASENSVNEEKSVEDIYQESTENDEK